jgi:low affinity Fe/Cu permease
MEKLFTKFAKGAAHWTGQPIAFLLAFGVIVGWVLTGPLFGFSDTWQLVINTGTTIITFLMVFLIQNTQNRDTKALQLKLDELIFVTARANNSLLDLEELEETDLDTIRDRYEAQAAQARQAEAPIPPAAGPDPARAPTPRA